MNRIDAKFRKLRQEKKKALVAFITAGDPNLAVTERLVLKFAHLGVDVLELGVPFSDPLADGATIQAASQRALKNRVKLRDVFRLVRALRRRVDLPIALLSYYNIVLRFGIEDFIKQAKAAGVDGVIVPDLPPEEAKDLIKAARKKDFATIFLLAPTSDAQRTRQICAQSSGFIYYVSLTGTTGVRNKIPGQLLKKVRQIKRITSKPVCVGFGISSPEQAKMVASVADGVIVGSAIIKVIEKNLKSRKDLISEAVKFTCKLRQAI